MLSIPLLSVDGNTSFRFTFASFPMFPAVETCGLPDEVSVCFWLLSFFAWCLHEDPSPALIGFALLVVYFTRGVYKLEGHLFKR